MALASRALTVRFACAGKDGSAVSLKLFQAGVKPIYRIDHQPCDGTVQRIALTANTTTALKTDVDAPKGSKYSLLITRGRTRRPGVLASTGRRSPRHPDTRPHLDSLGASVVEVYCWCPPAEAARRYAERAVRVHPVHVIHELQPEVLAQYDRPLGYGPVVTVDTTRPTDPFGIAAQVRQAFDEEMTRP